MAKPIGVTIGFATLTVCPWIFCSQSVSFRGYWSQVRRVTGPNPKPNLYVVVDLRNKETNKDGDGDGAFHMYTQ